MHGAIQWLAAAMVFVENTLHDDSRDICNDLVRTSVEESLFEEVLKQMLVRPHLFARGIIVHKVSADVMHPCVEVRANVSAEHIPGIKVITTEP